MIELLLFSIFAALAFIWYTLVEINTTLSQLRNVLTHTISRIGDKMPSQVERRR